MMISFGCAKSTLRLAIADDAKIHPVVDPDVCVVFVLSVYDSYGCVQQALLLSSCASSSPVASSSRKEQIAASMLIFGALKT